MRQIIKNTWTVLDKKERKQFVLLTLLAMLISLADILSLVALLGIIHFYMQPGINDLSFLPGWLANRDSVLLVAVFVVLFSLKNIAAYLIAKAHYTFTGRVAIRLSFNSLTRFQQSAFTEFVNTDSSLLIRRIALQPFEFSQHVLSGLQQIITQLSLIVIAVAAILLFNAKLFLLLLAVLLPPVVAVFYFIKRKMTVIKDHIRQSNEQSYQYLLDALKGYVEANVYQRNDFFSNRFIQSRRRFSKNLFSSSSLQNLPGRVIEIFAVLGLFALIVIAKWTHDSSDLLLSIGAFMAAAYKIIPGLVKVITLGGQMRTYEFSADELMPEDHKLQRKQKDAGLNSIESIAFSNVCFQYAGQPVLNNFSFSASKGELIGISAISGKGKTTILNLLLGFLKPNPGEIMINDTALTGEELKRYWPSVSYVKQQSFFIHDTILRNITLQEKDHDKDRLAFALQVSGVDKLAGTFPEGVEKIITENGKNISGGQQQRIAIARALYKNADLILLDEPFNELDEPSSLSILEHFRQLAKEKIVILVTHDKKSLSLCTKTIFPDEQG